MDCFPVVFFLDWVRAEDFFFADVPRLVVDFFGVLDAAIKKFPLHQAKIVTVCAFRKYPCQNRYTKLLISAMAPATKQ